MSKKKKIILAITGASGARYGIRTLQALKELDIEVHLIISSSGINVLKQENQNKTIKNIINSADYNYDLHDFHAPIASGSFHTDGMMIIPCSIKTLSGIANSYATNLIIRAGDVCLKERRHLLLAVRETPLHIGHLKLMKRAANNGAIIFPPVPALYHKPQSIDDLISTSVGRMLLQIGIDNNLYTPWTGE